MNFAEARLPKLLILPLGRAWLLSAGGLASAAATGAAIGVGRTEVALVPAAAIVALLVPSLTLAHWVGLLMIWSIAGRTITLIGLPASMVFLHYPITVGFAISAVLRQRGQGGGSRVGCWLLGLLFVSVVSMTGNGSHPLRAAIFLLILGQPLLVLWAVLSWPPDPAARRRVGVLSVALLSVQVPVGLAQGLTLGWHDEVRGTFVGSGNGAHQLGALMALGLLVTAAAVLAGRLPKPAGVVIGTGAIGMIVAAGANQVMLSLALGLACLPLLVVASRQIMRIRTHLVVGGALLTVVLTIVGIAWMQRADGSNILRRSRGLVSVGHLPELQLQRDRLAADPAALVLGAGPGTTASRASLLLTPAMMKESSPLVALQLLPTEAAMRLVRETQSRWGGSADSFASGILGITGDLGLLGLVGLAIVLTSVWRMLGRSGDWLAPAARSALLMTAVLLFVDNWLEYPEFAVPLSVLIGFALRSPDKDAARAS